jgi:hypothetical protein
MDEQMLAQAREEMISHDNWVSRTMPILTKGLGAARVEDLIQGLGHDRIAKEIQFTQGMINEAEKANREEAYGYTTIMVRLCAALYQLAEAQIEIEQLRNTLPFEGNRRTGTT